MDAELGFTIGNIPIPTSQNGVRRRPLDFGSPKVSISMGPSALR